MTLCFNGGFFFRNFCWRNFFWPSKNLRKPPIFGVETGLFLMLISKKTSSKSGTLAQTCTAHFQLWWNTINLSLKCQNKPVILMRLDSWHNSREFQENFKIWNGIFREVSWSIRVKLQFFILTFDTILPPQETINLHIKQKMTNFHWNSLHISIFSRNFHRNWSKFQLYWMAIFFGTVKPSQN